MRRFIPEDMPRYVSAIETSTSYRQAILKLGGKHHDYETIKRVAKETGARLLPRSAKGVDLVPVNVE